MFSDMDSSNRTAVTSLFCLARSEWILSSRRSRFIPSGINEEAEQVGDGDPEEAVCSNSWDGSTSSGDRAGSEPLVAIPLTLCKKMKNHLNLKLTALFVVIALRAWALGFIQGNTVGTRRMASVELLRSFDILKKLDQGDIREAATDTALVVASTSSWLDSEHFWLVALEHEFNEAPDQQVETIKNAAEELIRRERASVVEDTKSSAK